MRVLLIALALASPPAAAYGAEPSAAACRGVDATASESQRESTRGGCVVRMSSNGYPLPDTICTPGAINPTLTADVLKRKGFTTRCVRDSATSAKQKAGTYAWYSVEHPKRNTGKTQTCELDHVISLELGGADTLENIWPQCGPAKTPLNRRWFKIKDRVENFLAREVKAGRMELQAAQEGITSDWSQYVPAATAKRGSDGHRRSR